MLWIVAFVLLLASADSLTSNETIKSLWAEKYDPGNHRKLLYEKVCKSLTEKFQTPCNATWSFERFMHRYLDDAGAYVIYRSPENWTIKTPLEHYEETQDLKKYKVDVDDTRRLMTQSGGLTFKDFVDKYEPMTAWEQAKEEAWMVGNDNTPRSSFIEALDSTDELLSLSFPHSGRRWWNNKWVEPQQPHRPNLKNKYGDQEFSQMNIIIYFMKQDIYQAREKIKIMQTLRKEYKATGLYKMGYLFGKTDYACKVFSSLAYKSFKLCTMIRHRIFNLNRMFFDMLDIAYNMERLLSRWFDIDLLKDLIVSNDATTRKVLLKNEKLTVHQVVKSFNEMFID